MANLGFAGVDPQSTGRPSYHPAVQLGLNASGYVNAVQSSRRLERGCSALDTVQLSDFRLDLAYRGLDGLLRHVDDLDCLPFAWQRPDLADLLRLAPTMFDEELGPAVVTLQSQDADHDDGIERVLAPPDCVLDGFLDRLRKPITVFKNRADAYADVY